MSLTSPADQDASVLNTLALWLETDLINASELATAKLSPFPSDLDRYISGKTGNRLGSKRLRAAVARLVPKAIPNRPLQFYQVHELAKRKRNRHKAYPLSVEMGRHMRLGCGYGDPIDSLKALHPFLAKLDDILGASDLPKSTEYQRAALAFELFPWTSFSAKISRKAYDRDFAGAEDLAAAIRQSIFLEIDPDSRWAVKVLTSLRNDYSRLVAEAMSQLHWTRQTTFLRDFYSVFPDSPLTRWMELIASDGLIEREKRGGAWYIIAQGSPLRNLAVEPMNPRDRATVRFTKLGYGSFCGVVCT